ncbi:hydrolase [Microtetraspora sp. NBRC 13810]|uniref:carbon-nitrogen hydrolase family protein n=1 Tax=Microtetraspora sp. NBRC 13810 TaxID=3030990 RepID=UPI0024A11273|nr:carbon-nitrogen hydrolase family protein [Microtetraspora sp. NBRC 13810]GLW09691.1 hydrolase [Microtetraspora sp. NBRC 13810]
MTPTHPIRIAAAQAQAMPGDVDANAATVAAMVTQAGADVIVFPEKFLTGYEPALIQSAPTRHAVQRDDPRLTPITTACRETATVAIVGAAVLDEDDLYVSALVIGRDGRLVTRYDKQMLFKHEQQVYRPGKAGCTLDVDGWRLGLGICYDSGFPEHARAAALDGCHAYVVGALFSVGHGYHESRTWFPARALDNTCYAVLSNHIGRTGGWDTCGASAIWGPDGHLITEASPTHPEIITATLDPHTLQTTRATETLLHDLTHHPLPPTPRTHHAIPHPRP